MPASYGEFRSRLFDGHVVQRRPVRQIRSAAAGHHRARQHAVDLHAIGDAAIRERLGERDDGRVDRAHGRIRRFRKQRRISRHEHDRPLVAFSAGHAAIVRRRAPCSLSARPPSHCSSVISNRSICGTAPAMLSSASICPNAASVWSTTFFGAATRTDRYRSRAALRRRLLPLLPFLRDSPGPRATSAIAEKSCASRMAVERPIPWLAPVTIATDSGHDISPE